MNSSTKSNDKPNDNVEDGFVVITRQAKEIVIDGDLVIIDDGKGGRFSTAKGSVTVWLNSDVVLIRIGDGILSSSADHFQDLRAFALDEMHAR